MDVEDVDEGDVATLATLNPKQLQFISQISQDIRATVSYLSLPKVSPLSVLDTAAIDCLKDLYYGLNNEDPLNSMPLRRHILDINLAVDCLMPIAVAANSDPAAARNKKQWSLSTYQTLRLLSVLTLPISAESELPAPAQLDYLLLELRFQLALNHKALFAYVCLLQYYVERKAEKRASFTPSEESKLEDARIDNIFRFFCNILSPPRSGVNDAILQRDRAVHLALIGSLVKVDFYSTLSVLFSSAEDSRAHYSDLVFITADIYAQTYRNSSPLQLFQFFIKDKAGVENRSSNPTAPNSTLPTVEKPPPVSVFDEDNLTSHEAAEEPKQTKTASHHAFNLRDALLRERSAIGGSRAALAGARWTSRHSGGIVRTIRNNGDSIASVSVVRNPNGFSTLKKRRILPAKGAIQCSKAFNPMHDLQEDVRVNSELLCLYAIRKRTGIVQKAAKKQSLPPVRHDLIENGLRGLVSMTEELVDISFQFYVRELRDRILESRERARADEQDTLKNAERSYLSIVGSVVGFHREKHGKIYKIPSVATESEVSVSAEVHQNDMKQILGRDFKIVKFAWKQVEAAIELESFQLVFSVLVDACAQLKESSKDDQKSQLIELSTFSVLEMMKMLQGMAAKVAQEIEESENARQGDLTPREVALNTLEQLFERESFLNAPADLAKMFNTKLFSFRHLSNIVEMTYTFTAILLDEQELSHLTVAVVKRKRKLKQKKIKEDKDGGLSKDEGDVEKTSDSKGIKAITRPSRKIEANSDEGKTGMLEERESVVSGGSGNEERSGEEVTTDKDTVDGEDARAASRVQKLLRADEEARLAIKKETIKYEVNTRVEKMLLADRQADIESVPNPQYVTSLDGKDVHDNMLVKHHEGNESDDDENENLMREVESIGIVRRFAHSKAVATLLVPLRVAVCKASELVGKVSPVPEGSEILDVPTLLAKSASVVRSIWSVAQHRERGILCAHFFSFEIMQFLRIAVSAQSKKLCKPRSVLAHVSELGAEVTKVFFKWLNAHPALIYDLFLTMDKSYTASLVRKVNADEQETQQGVKKTRKRRKRDGELEKGKVKSDSLHLSSDELSDDILSSTEPNNNDQDGESSSEPKLENHKFVVDDDVDDVDGLNFGPRHENRESGRKQRRASKPSKVLKRRRRRKNDRSEVEEDEDVDDLDNLRFGQDSSSDEEVNTEIEMKASLDDTKVSEGDDNEKVCEEGQSE